MVLFLQATNELKRCKYELSTKRKELARMQRQLDVVVEVFAMVSSLYAQSQELAKVCKSRNLKKKAKDMKNALGRVIGYANTVKVLYRYFSLNFV